MRRAALLVGALLCVGTSAHAFTPTAQDRHVYGKHRVRFFPSFDMTFEETLSAPDFGPFSASTDGTPPSAIFNPGPVASQSSSIEPEQLHATGGTLADPSAGVESLHEMESRSVYSVDFEIDEERAFTLAGQIDLSFDNPLYPSPDSLLPCSFSTVRITLSGPGGVVAEVAHMLPPFGGLEACWEHCEASLPISASGVLAPGSYRLVARSDSNGRGILAAHSECDHRATGSYAADLVLAPTVPALPGALAPLLGIALVWTARRKS